jgi:acetate kinase
MPVSETILVANAGSSSIKCQLFSVASDVLERLLRGQIEGVGIKPHLERRLTGSHTNR